MCLSVCLQYVCLTVYILSFVCLSARMYVFWFVKKVTFSQYRSTLVFIVHFLLCISMETCFYSISEQIDLIFCIAYHAVLSFFIKCVINGNILSMCVLPVVVYDAAKRIVKLSSIVPLLIGEVNDHFTSEGHNTCLLVVIA